MRLTDTQIINTRPSDRLLGLRYQHHRNRSIYEIIGFALDVHHKESPRWNVLYKSLTSRPLPDGKHITFSRPFDEFFGQVSVPRFGVVEGDPLMPNVEQQKSVNAMVADAMNEMRQVSEEHTRQASPKSIFRAPKGTSVVTANATYFPNTDDLGTEHAIRWASRTAQRIFGSARMLPTFTPAIPVFPSTYARTRWKAWVDEPNALPVAHVQSGALERREMGEINDAYIPVSRSAIRAMLMSDNPDLVLIVGSGDDMLMLMWGTKDTRFDWDTGVARRYGVPVEPEDAASDEPIFKQPMPERDDD